MSDFSQKLLKWFEQHGRKDLPWQQEITPYKVWISEIMLQQTQVSTVIPYFHRFLKTFPTVHHLANAPLDDVLKLWSGLGYYARGRNLHRSSRLMVEQFSGNVPADLQALQSLPGVGRSTAGAIVSMGFNEACAILDGNVKRVLCRYHAVPGWPSNAAVQKTLWALAESHVPSKNGRDYSQAIMDLGATVCLPQNPQCARCPVQKGCQAHHTQTVEEYPSPRPKMERPIQKFYFIFALNAEGKIYLEQRPEKGIWGGLWCAPQYQGSLKALSDWFKENLQTAILEQTVLRTIKHQLTHFEFQITPLICHVQSFKTNRSSKMKVQAPSKGQWWTAKQALKLGLPAPAKRLLSHILKGSTAAQV